MFIMYTFPLTPTASHVKQRFTHFHLLLYWVYFGIFKIFLETWSDLYLSIHHIYFTIRHSDLIKTYFYSVHTLHFIRCGMNPHFYDKFLLKIFTRYFKNHRNLYPFYTNITVLSFYIGQLFYLATVSCHFLLAHWSH